jgi:hypothetical protein
MKKLLLCLTLAACDRTADLAMDHLTVRGSKTVTCAGESNGEALCLADGVRYRCVASSGMGCGPSAIACERLQPEMP